MAVPSSGSELSDSEEGGESSTVEADEGPSRGSTPFAGPAPCVRPECPCDSYNGKVGEHCCRTCLDSAACVLYDGQPIHQFEPISEEDEHLLALTEVDESTEPTVVQQACSVCLKTFSCSSVRKDFCCDECGDSVIESEVLHEWSVKHWPLLVVPGFDVAANAVYLQKENGWKIPIRVDDMETGPDQVGLFPNAYNSATNRQLTHGVFASVLQPLASVDWKRQFEVIQAWKEAKRTGASPVSIPEKGSRHDRNLVKTVKVIAATRRSEPASQIDATGTLDARSPEKRVTAAGIYIPQSGWDEEILSHILGNLERISPEPWSESDHIHYRTQLMEKDWSSLQVELPDLLLSMALHDAERKVVSTTQTLDRLKLRWDQAVASVGGDLVLGVLTWVQGLHMQDSVPDALKVRSHAIQCVANETGICSRTNVASPTFCPAELQYSTIKLYKSKLKNHPDLSMAEKAACTHDRVSVMMKELKRSQAESGRNTKGGTICEQHEFVNINVVVRRWRDAALQDGEDPLVIFKLDAFRVYVIFVKYFARRGLNILHLRKSKIWLLLSGLGRLVLAIDLMQNKVAHCDPTGLCYVDAEDVDGPLVAVREMYEHLQAYGADVSMKNPSLFTRYEYRDDQYLPVAASKSNKYSTWLPASFDKLLKKAAGEAGARDSDKITVKSFRMLNVALGNAGGVSQEELNLRMGWTDGSNASQNYVRLARMLGKVVPSITEEQRQALNNAAYVPFRDLLREGAEFCLDEHEAAGRSKGELVCASAL